MNNIKLDPEQILQMMINYEGRSLPRMGVCPKCRKTSDLRIVDLDGRWVYFYQCAVCKTVKHTNGTHAASVRLTDNLRAEVSSITEEAEAVEETEEKTE